MCRVFPVLQHQASGGFDGWWVVGRRGKGRETTTHSKMDVNDYGCGSIALVAEKVEQIFANRFDTGELFAVDGLSALREPAVGGRGLERSVK